METEVVITETLNAEVSETDIHMAVKQYAEKQGAAGKRTLEATLIAKPVKFSENTIVVTIENEAQKLLFDDIKQDFLDAIRATVKNNLLQLEILQTEDNSVKKAYTPNEKFAAMTAKNPLLLELKKRLDLEVGL